ncbi:MAG: sensor histidine kinase [Akkermansiaceae bacterium]|nr:sensor histidine kinase [Akkermansiaceae bacterium]
MELNISWPAVDWILPGNFHLLVQDLNDIVVVREAPWWTPRRIWVALSMVALSAAAAAGWVMILRRQVEFHDTLEQELTGLSIQMDAASDSLPARPDHALKALECARTLLDYTRGEARRSIWDLRAMAIQEKGLFGALEWSGEQFRGAGSPDIRFSCIGETRRLDSRVENHLLRIATECLTNVVKHSGASSVDVKLSFEASEVILSVEDAGVGFVLPGPEEPLKGHFGLRGMKERANQIGAKLEVTTRVGEGTRIEVRVPLEKNSKGVRKQSG